MGKVLAIHGRCFCPLTIGETIMIKKMYKATKSGQKTVWQKTAEEYVRMARRYTKREFVREITRKTGDVVRCYAFAYVADRYMSFRSVSYWRERLVDIITGFQKMDTFGAGGRDMVFAMVREVWITKMKLDTRPQAIIHKYIGSFTDEYLDCDEDEHMDIVDSFIGNMDRMAREMAYGDYYSALGFVLSLRDDAIFSDGYAVDAETCEDKEEVSLDEFIQRVLHMRLDIVRNWMMFRYYQLFDAGAAELAEWRSTIERSLTGLKHLCIDDDADKYIVLYRLFVLWADCDDANMVMNIAKHVFSEAGITDDFKIAKVCTEFAEGVEKLIYAVSFDGISISSYMKVVFCR